LQLEKKMPTLSPTLMKVPGFIFREFSVAVMLRLLAAIITGLLLLLGFQAVYGRGFQIFYSVDQILVWFICAQLKIPPCLPNGCEFYYVLATVWLFVLYDHNPFAVL
jgi:hypothetical protein